MAILIAGKDGTANSLKKQAARKGWLRLAPGIYSDGAENLPADILRKWRDIVRALYPDAIVSHRSAIRMMPEKGAIFLTRPQASHTKKTVGPLKLFVTPGQTHSHTRLIDKDLRASDDARAWLENFSDTRQRDGLKPALSQDEMEIELEKVMAARGEEYLKQILQQAKELSVELGLEKAREKLEACIGALCATRSYEGVLKTDVAIARAQRKPFDTHIVRRFDELAKALLNADAPAIKTQLDMTAWKSQAFIESYFSNYIEGTEFLLSEAEDIVFERKVDESRHADSHDILAVYDLASDIDGMLTVPRNPDELRELLVKRHAFLMHDRPDKNPGQWKRKPNRAGNIVFASPEKVNGTLTYGFDQYQNLPNGFARALFIHFVITQAHPFDDGNGRLARIFMSAELTHAGESKIIIPTVKRDDYINGLRHANADGNFDVMFKVMEQLYHYTAALPWHDYGDLIDTLTRHHAFDKPDDGLQLFSRSLKSVISGQF